MSELTLEEAAEMVLALPAWKPCIICRGQGNITQERAQELNLLVGSRLSKCEVCHGAGYLSPPGLQDAYRITKTPYPDKPLSGPDYYKQTMRSVQQSIQESLKGYIGNVRPNKQLMIDEIARVLEDYVPETKLSVTARVDDNDSTLMHFNIEGAKFHDHALSNEELIELYNKGPEGMKDDQS